MKGLHCGIFKDSSLRGCANGGLSERADDVTLIVTDEKAEKMSLPFEPDEKAPAVKIVKRFICGREYVHAEPLDPPPKGMIGWLDGGCYIMTSDSRYKNITGLDYPIALHDRCDTPEDYEALSR